jgi:hypothetical protein
VHLLDDSKETAPPPKGAGGLAELPLRPSFFDTVSDSAEGAVRDARELMAAINKVLTPENRKSIGASGCRSSAPKARPARAGRPRWGPAFPV